MPRKRWEQKRAWVKIRYGCGRNRVQNVICIHENMSSQWRSNPTLKKYYTIFSPCLSLLFFQTFTFWQCDYCIIFPESKACSEKCWNNMRLIHFDFIADMFFVVFIFILVLSSRARRPKTIIKFILAVHVCLPVSCKWAGQKQRGREHERKRAVNGNHYWERWLYLNMLSQKTPCNGRTKHSR